jgi:hypothetical protein
MHVDTKHACDKEKSTCLQTVDVFAQLGCLLILSTPVCFETRHSFVNQAVSHGRVGADAGCVELQAFACAELCRMQEYGMPQESEFGRLPRLARPINHQIRSEHSPRCQHAVLPHLSGPPCSSSSVRRRPSASHLYASRSPCAKKDGARGWSVRARDSNRWMRPRSQSTEQSSSMIAYGAHNPRSHYARPKQTWHIFNSRCTAKYCAAISSSKRSALSTSDCPGLSPVPDAD